MNQRHTAFLAFLAFGLSTFLPAQAVETGCVPSEPMQSPRADTVPDTFPDNIFLPEGLALMSSEAGAPDEYMPYGYASIEFVVDSDREKMFALYEAELVKAGYRVVMWEKDTNWGLRFRGDDIDEGTISFSDYDCYPLIGIRIMFLP